MTDEKLNEKWECFCDEGYYHMWAVCDANGSKAFTDAIHVRTKEEAEFLVERLNRAAPQWLPIETAPNEVWNFSPVDLWLVIKPSIQTMGFGDSFRVVDCYKKYGKGPWCHLHNGEEKEIKHELITHWMPLPAPPQTEKETER